MENSTNHTAKKTTTNWSTTISIAIIGLLFFIFGFTTWINAILIPYFKISCELNNVESLFVAFAFYIAYLVMAIPAAHLLEKIGFKKGIMIGFWIMALGALLFVPALRIPGKQVLYSSLILFLVLLLYFYMLVHRLQA